VCGLRRAQHHGVCTINRLPSILAAPAISSRRTRVAGLRLAENA
jgi:hypothetical protein